jgi:Ca2+-binding RTX toxin-like protein
MFHWQEANTMGKKKKGTELSDSWFGGNKNDKYDGLGGDDAITGMDGNDKLWGGDGNDAIQGTDGNDKIWGGAGFDRMTGGAGKDTLWGGTETDAFIFSAGGKFGPGSDTDIIKDIDTEGDDMDDIQIMSLDGSIDSFADIMKHADQDGKDVRINFGNGDVLILEGVKKGDLSAELFMYEG